MAGGTVVFCGSGKIVNNLIYSPYMNEDTETFSVSFKSIKQRLCPADKLKLLSFIKIQQRQKISEICETSCIPTFEYQGAYLFVVLKHWLRLKKITPRLNIFACKHMELFYLYVYKMYKYTFIN